MNQFSAIDQFENEMRHFDNGIEQSPKPQAIF